MERRITGQFHHRGRHHGGKRVARIMAECGRRENIMRKVRARAEQRDLLRLRRCDQFNVVSGEERRDGERLSTRQADSRGRLLCVR
jgi:hypothetical protein